MAGQYRSMGPQSGINPGNFDWRAALQGLTDLPGKAYNAIKDFKPYDPEQHPNHGLNYEPKLDSLFPPSPPASPPHPHLPMGEPYQAPTTDDPAEMTIPFNPAPQPQSNVPAGGIQSHITSPYGPKMATAADIHPTTAGELADIQTKHKMYNTDAVLAGLKAAQKFGGGYTSRYAPPVPME